MLASLEVKNLLLFRAAALRLSKGFTVLTGETGAGKSLLLRALWLAVGGRVDWGAEGSRRAEVSALFRDAGKSILLRRVVDPGRRRAVLTLNGARAKKEEIEWLADRVEIHGQHEGSRLLESSGHLDALDRFGGVKVNRELYLEWKEAALEVERLTVEMEGAARERELARLQVEELSGLAPEEKEATALQARIRSLSNVEAVRGAVASALEALTQGEGSAHTTAAQALERLLRDAGDDPEAARAAELVRAGLGGLSEAAGLLERRLESLHAEPGELDALQGRLFDLKAAAKRYGVEPDGLASLLKQLASVAGGGSPEKALMKANERLKRKELKLRESERRLTKERAAAAVRLERRMNGQLPGLGMEGARFVVKVEGAERGPLGADSVLFLVSTVKGEPPRELGKVASGGELSRIMLALKALTASEREETAVMVFDEIDAAIGGRAAELVGRRLRELAAHHQVLAVTHLPQIAAFGHTHFVVERKKDETTVREVAGEERVREVARMAAGEEVTQEAVEHARALLEGAG